VTNEKRYRGIVTVQYEAQIIGRTHYKDCPNAAFDAASRLADKFNEQHKDSTGCEGLTYDVWVVDRRTGEKVRINWGYNPDRIYKMQII